MKEKKLNRASVIHETTSSRLRDVYLESLNFSGCEERGRRIGKIFEEIIAKLFTNVMKIINSQIQEPP